MTETKQRFSQRWLIAGSLLLGLMLTAFPLSGVLALMRPDWIALMIVYWAIFASRQLGVAMILLSGLALDVLYGMLLGQHSLALLIIAYFPLRWHLRLRVMSWIQLAAVNSVLVLLYEFLLFWINGMSGRSSEWLTHTYSWLASSVAWLVVVFALGALHFAPRRSD